MLNTQLVTIYLIGFSGTGKYTLAKELEKSHYKIVDNHLINNPIFSLLTIGKLTTIPEEAWEAISKIREAVLDYIALDREHNYVLTNELLEDESDHQIFNQVKMIAERRKSLFVPIKLEISDNEHEKRMTNPQRLERFKETRYPVERFKAGLISVDHPHLTTLDVTVLTPQQAAEKILETVVKFNKI